MKFYIIPGISVAAIIAIFVLAVLTFPLYIGNRVNVPDVDTSSMVESVPTRISVKGVLEVRVEGGQGTCFTVAKRDGWYYAITAAHVVETSDYLSEVPDFSASSFVTVDEGRYRAEVMVVDSEVDIAIIRFRSPRTYPIYEVARARLGEACTTIGWSRGAFLQYKGYIVTLDYTGHVMANGGVVPGCSGGPLLNADGAVIGVTVAMPVYGFSAFDSSAMYVPARFVEALIIMIGD